MTGSIHSTPFTVIQPNYVVLLLTIQIGLMSYNIQVAFKNVEKQHRLYCNIVNICDSIIFPE